jgi:Lon protease-like protein
LPGGRLPLNIFEPRYLNLVADSLAIGRVFGIIQHSYEGSGVGIEGSGVAATTSSDESSEGLGFCSIGCIGKIVYFEETDDGRFLIALRGLCRFKVIKETNGLNGYRKVNADYSSYEFDFEPSKPIQMDRTGILEAIKPYAESHSLQVKYDMLDTLPDATLVTALSMICPFKPREKQALLESQYPKDRAEMLLALLQMGVFDSDSGLNVRQ